MLPLDCLISRLQIALLVQALHNSRIQVVPCTTDLQLALCNRLSKNRERPNLIDDPLHIRSYSIVQQFTIHLLRNSDRRMDLLYQHLHICFGGLLRLDAIDGSLDCPALCMPQHHKQGDAEDIHAIFQNSP